MLELQFICSQLVIHFVPYGATYRLFWHWYYLCHGMPYQSYGLHEAQKFVTPSYLESGVQESYSWIFYHL